MSQCMLSAWNSAGHEGNAIKGLLNKQEFMSSVGAIPAGFIREKCVWWWEEGAREG